MRVGDPVKVLVQRGHLSWYLMAYFHSHSDKNVVIVYANGAFQQVPTCNVFREVRNRLECLVETIELTEACRTLLQLRACSTV